MHSKKQPRKIIPFDQLTPLGRAVWLAGTAAYLGTRVIRHVGRVAVQTKKAFHEGLASRSSDEPPRTPPSP